MPSHVSPDQIRARFSAAMSAMYRTEVPLYGQLLDIVASVNATHGDAVDEGRLGAERHGAIRVGTAAELSALRRLFAVMGMHPVGYYDLSVAGMPIHSTAFRPITAAAMTANPFRMFCSLLRLEQVEERAVRDIAAEILASRRICSDRLMDLIAQAEADGGLPDGDAAAFLDEAVGVFRWHGTARVDLATYRELVAAHRLVADIVSFAGPHINHLTPRTVDIDAAQREMQRRGMVAKESIEGPPRRRCPILLRQTSFKALSEPVSFGGETGAHTARFGEIEQRGAALTRKGRELYDTCLAAAQEAGDDPIALASAFDEFPDDWSEMQREDLAFFYNEDHVSDTGESGTGPRPITYEDFLPVSAAGIFRSNLDTDRSKAGAGHPAQTELESALGTQIHDPFVLYAADAARTAAPG
ncbi:VOC family protein [Croceicoccus sp. F390]|uniref:2-oxoadipate dioxygenase/decarboxylase n=1 Tax=Croceicoccus esteveae TaxID=3075597 RepID=A0ABU2ZG03_9SPHN|nr:VOC family protein [Croceicoccus sp. F390]MDT0575530.1 VOC family protein [Croceicoccus sp. F390]